MKKYYEKILSIFQDPLKAINILVTADTLVIPGIVYELLRDLSMIGISHQ